MARKAKTAGPAVQWKSRARIVRTADAIYQRLESVDGRYLLIKTESLLGGSRGYPDRWTPFRVAFDDRLGITIEFVLWDASGHVVQYEVSRRIKSYRAANQKARELAMRACCLHARGEPIPPARKPVNRRSIMFRAMRRVEAGAQ